MEFGRETAKLAEDCGVPSLEAAYLYQTGLMIALLALRPYRRAVFASFDWIPDPVLARRHDGQAGLDAILAERILALRAERDTVQAALDRARGGVQRAPVTFDSVQIEAFGRLMRERLTTGEISFRKAYLGAISDRVEVDDHQIRIFGRKDVLEQAVLANGAPPQGVRSFVRRWRTRQDSNL